jgi:hypothetical protein
VELELVAESNTAQLNEGLFSPGLAPERIERGYTALADWHRVAGVCRLLAHADGEGFRRGLRSAGDARLELLRIRARSKRPFNSHTGAGRYLPLCCAIAAGADATALEICQLSADAPVPREEIEEDALYGVALSALAQGWPLVGPLTALQALVGDDDPRCGLLRVLAEKRSADFDAALEALRAAWVEWLESIPRMNRGETFQADRGVFIEGLALLRLAARLGMPVGREYRDMPSLARVP